MRQIEQARPENQERLDALYWGGYRLLQNPAWFCFSLDAVILAWFAPLRPGGRVLDLGCGNGVLPLLLLARERTLRVTGLELMAPLADLARRNMALNGVDVEIVAGNIRGGEALFPQASFDLIVTNPPYETAGGGRLPTEPLKAAARAELYCNLDDVFKTAAALLKPRGRLALVHRAKRLADIVAGARGYGLEAKILRLIAPNREGDANLLYLEAVKGGKPGLRIPPPLAVYDGAGAYSAEMETIFRGPKTEFPPSRQRPRPHPGGEGG